MLDSFAPSISWIALGYLSVLQRLSMVDSVLVSKIKLYESFDAVGAIFAEREVNRCINGRPQNGSTS